MGTMEMNESGPYKSFPPSPSVSPSSSFTRDRPESSSFEFYAIFVADMRMPKNNLLLISIIPLSYTLLRAPTKRDLEFHRETCSLTPWLGCAST